ncbi:MAG: hypothetical protein LBB05_03590 [Puniceicoccales bacterium]|jgi:hypothetical protein|nr:hypothetical protein [Puniceicoccales bacterium]
MISSVLLFSATVYGSNPSADEERQSVFLVNVDAESLDGLARKDPSRAVALNLARHFVYTDRLDMLTALTKALAFLYHLDSSTASSRASAYLTRPRGSSTVLSKALACLGLREGSSTNFAARREESNWENMVYWGRLFDDLRHLKGQSVSDARRDLEARRQEAFEDNTTFWERERDWDCIRDRMTLAQLGRREFQQIRFQIERKLQRMRARIILASQIHLPPMREKAQRLYAPIGRGLQQLRARIGSRRESSDAV